MRNHIILGRGRSIHKQHIHHALHYHHLAHKHGHGTPAIKKNWGGMMRTNPSAYTNPLASHRMPTFKGGAGEGVKHHNKHFKPLKFKM